MESSAGSIEIGIGGPRVAWEAWSRGVLIVLYEGGGLVLLGEGLRLIGAHPPALSELGGAAP